jgi:hypothetical protein
MTTKTGYGLAAAFLRMAARQREMKFVVQLNHVDAPEQNRQYNGVTAQDVGTLAGAVFGTLAETAARAWVHLDVTVVFGAYKVHVQTEGEHVN